ncbi:uncharacterized protein LOC123539877 [Mercenaria mercenaria]|uniref:uncharacterized protein LOC123539877 n=1 Tax=Mercenaria mercenaria TaxID=6596 RepID=UPI00234EE419|nr:uncharacterized protein LOC123539877 [Mercenaria mercenaria]
MANRNSTLFGHLIAFYPNLKKLKLSSNRLTMIPKQMFNTNKNLEEIELSSNLLTQVTFRLEHLVNLKILSLQNNRISILNYDSRLILNSLLMTINTDRNISATLQIANNPISCSECDTLASIEWLSTTSLSYGDIHCKNPEGNLISIDHIATNFVQEECDRAVRIRNAIVLSVLIPISIIISMVLIMCKWRTNRQKQFYRKKMEQKIRKIQMNELDTKYLIFLAFSSYDYNFLNNNVFGPLKHHLQLKTGTDRDLICFGDKNFQLGKPVHDEMALCLQQSAVVMLLLSRSFCNSEFCRMEFDMALFMKKPFILMIKDELDESEMVPSLQELFKRNTRLLWERRDNHFYLRTSWDNVVNSVLELVP